jgi:amino acid transporter
MQRILHWNVFCEVVIFYYLFVYLLSCASDFKFSDTAKRERERKVQIYRKLPKKERERKRSVVQEMHSLSVAAAMLPIITVAQSYYLLGTGYNL